MFTKDTWDFIPLASTYVFGIDDAALAAMMAALAEGTATVAAPTAAEAGALGAGAAGTMAGGWGPAVAAGTSGAAGAGAGGAAMSPELMNARISEMTGGNQPGLLAQSMKPAQDFMSQLPSMTDTMENVYQGNIGAEMANATKGPIGSDPLSGMLSQKPAAPPTTAPQAPNRAPQSSPLDWDWQGAQDKAERFVKLSKSVQDFASAMRGEPDPNQKISEAAPRQNIQPYQHQNPPQGALPSTTLVPPYVDQRERLSMTRRY